MKQVYEQDRDVFKGKRTFGGIVQDVSFVFHYCPTPFSSFTVNRCFLDTNLFGWNA